MFACPDQILFDYYRHVYAHTPEGHPARGHVERLFAEQIMPTPSLFG